MWHCLKCSPVERVGSKDTSGPPRLWVDNTRLWRPVYSELHRTGLDARVFLYIAALRPKHSDPYVSDLLLFKHVPDFNRECPELATTSTVAQAAKTYVPLYDMILKVLQGFTARFSSY